MKRILLTLFAFGLIVANDTTTWAQAVTAACPGKCPLCP